MPTIQVESQLTMWWSTVIGNHGLYLAGRKEYLSVSNSTITSGTTPMRIGVVLKQGNHTSINYNRISNFLEQGIELDSNAPDQIVSDILISGNSIVTDRSSEDLYIEPTTHISQPVNTHGIQLNTGTNVTIANNSISETNFSGIYVGAALWPISDMTISNNLISQTKNGIVSTFSPVSIRTRHQHPLRPC